MAALGVSSTALIFRWRNDTASKRPRQIPPASLCFQVQQACIKHHCVPITELTQQWGRRQMHK